MNKTESINWIISLTTGEVDIDALWDLSADEAEKEAIRLFQKEKFLAE